jgi:hypothetical protein
MRWPTIALLGALLVAGAAFDRVQRVEAEPPPGPFEATVTPVMVDPPRLSSVWYCPVGSSGGGYADHTVEVVNFGPDPAVATVSMFTDTGPGPSIRLDIGAGTRRSVALGELEVAPAAGAVVEIVDGQGAVYHVVATAQGQARGACATTASDQWHFAGGATTRDATYHLALLNPFPEDAVFDLRFETPGRGRAPSDLQGAIVPARSVRVVEVHAPEVVAREAAVAATITLRRGRIVAERLQTFDGVLGPVGAALALGAASPALETWFPAGRVHAGGDHRLVLYNPTDQAAELDVTLQPLDPAVGAAFGLVPFEVSVGPGRFEVLDLVASLGQLGVPLPFEAGVHVQSVNGTPVVAERWSLAPPVDTAAIGAGGTELSEGDLEQAPAEEAPGEPEPAEVETAAGSVVPVVLAAAQPGAAEPATEAPPPAAEAEAPAGGGEGPAGEVPAGEAPAGEVPVEEVPVEEVPVEEVPVEEVPVEEVPVEEAVPVVPQATASAGVVIDRGLVSPAARWVLPGTPMLAGEGTAVAVVGVDDAVTVEVRSMVGGDAAPLASFEVGAGQRLLVPIASPEPVSDLLVTASGRVVVAVSLVDEAGVGAVLGGIPVLVR